MILVIMAHKDHPRGCGEHSGSPLYIQKGVGSSPRMRGAPRPRSSAGLFHRIIPADAGSTGFCAWLAACP